MRPRDYLILFALVDSARHGYGIIRRIEENTDGTVRIDPANLYRAIKRLSRQDLIQEASGEQDDEEQAGGERRRFWTVTDLGRRVVRAEANRLARLTELAASSGLITD